jgi:hypothetical protein
MTAIGSLPAGLLLSKAYDKPTGCFWNQLQAAGTAKTGWKIDV